MAAASNTSPQQRPRDAGQEGGARTAGPMSHTPNDLADFPVREYIGAMAHELAQMARWDGDEPLGCLLDAVVLHAEQVNPSKPPVQRPAQHSRSRPA